MQHLAQDGGRTSGALGMTNCYSFRDATRPPRSAVGGKAIALIEATSAGFAVPDGFVLGVGFFAPWLETIQQSPLWSALLAAATEHSPGAATNKTWLRPHCDALQQLCGTLALSLAQRDELERALVPFDEETLLAVRSSSPEEDLATASFAGGYETTLGVTRTTLEAALVRCFTSLLDERVFTYKQQNQIPLDNPRIAVVVQQQIASEVSGVAFSLNPQNNDYDEVVINANFGLGETVVAGQVTPDTYVVDKIAAEILDRQVADKTTAVWLRPDGGTEMLPHATPNAAALTDAEVLQVAGLTESVERHFGHPVDIEWAWADGKLYLLQARPITTWLPLFSEMRTAPSAPRHLYLDLILLTQGFSESLSVLGGELWGRMLTAIKGPMMPAGPDGIVWNIHGRQYIHVSNMLKAFGPRLLLKQIGTYDASVRALFDSLDLAQFKPRQKPAALRGYLPRSLKHLLGLAPSMLRSVLRGRRAIRDLEDGSADIFDNCPAELATEHPFDELVERGLARFAGLNTSMVALVAALLARARLYRMFKNHDVDDLLVQLGMDLPGNPTSAMGYAMCQLAAFPEVRQAASGAALARELESGQLSPVLTQAYDDYLARFGCRCLREIDIAAPRPYEDPATFFDRLQQIDTDQNATTTVKQRSQAAYDELLALARRLGKEKKFRRCAQIHHDIFGYREQPKYIYVFITDLLRRRALVLGARFQAEDRLDDLRHIFDMTIDQITTAEADAALDLRALREQNLVPRRAVAHVQDWPRIIDSRGRIYRTQRISSEGDLVGDAISPGVVRGAAKVLSKPYEKPLRAGEILVTRATEPSWTPIFINAAGVVMEIGGPLQHGAIIAREYGIPCVSGLEGATTQIRDGDQLEVDGSSGLVRILKPASDSTSVSSSDLATVLPEDIVGRPSTPFTG